jgi:arylsulfatase A-like enzyme
MEDPAHPDYPQDLLDKVGPRNMVHSWATATDDPTEMPRWGKVGKQKIEDAGTLYPKRMETVDDEIRDMAFKFIDKAKADGKPFFVWLNPTRMHIVTHLSPKYEGMRIQERLVPPRSGHGAARRRRRTCDEEAQGHRRRRQHHRRVHHRQRH